MANNKRVITETAREPLICHVDKRHEIAFDNDIGNRQPFILGRVHTRRVVTAGMQQDEIASRHLGQRIQHLVYLDRVRVRVVIRIRFKL